MDDCVLWWSNSAEMACGTNNECERDGREKHADEKGGRILGESKEGEERWIKRVGKVEEGEGER